MLYYQSGGIMKDKIELYCELSHKLAMNQLIERFYFELEANRVIFNGDDISLESLINDCSNSEIFSDKEYLDAYRKSKIMLNREVSSSFCWENIL